MVRKILHKKYSNHNEGKSVVAERFIRTLKKKMGKHITSVPKNVCIDKLDDIVNNYNNTYHGTIKMKPVDVKWSTYTDFNKNNYNKNPKFKIVDHIRISKYKNIFGKSYLANWSEELFVTTKVKNIVPWTYVIRDLNGKDICLNVLRKRIAKNKSKRI